MDNIENPFFFISNPLIGIPVKELKNEFDCVYVLCLKNDYRNLKNYQQRIKLFYKEDSTIDDLKSQDNLVTIIRLPFQIYNNEKVSGSTLIVKKDILEKFNDDCYILKEEELVHVSLNHTQDSVLLWKEHEMQSVNSIQKFHNSVKKRIITSFKGIKCDSLIDFIRGLQSVKHWCNEENIKFNNSSYFNQRTFGIVIKEKWHDENIEATVNKIIQLAYRGEINYDDCHEINSNNECNLELSNTVNSKVAKELDEETLTRIMINNDISRREKYYIMCYLLASPNYCHLILNHDVLVKNNEIFMCYSNIFRYLMKYAWATLITEEQRTKKITLNDRIVFDIERASSLPVFYSNREFLYIDDFYIECPYFFVPYSTKYLRLPNANIMGKCPVTNPHIPTLERFREKFNIFMTWNSKKDIFEGLDWTNLAVCGSVMPACLTENIYEEFDLKSNRCVEEYFKKEYSDSDLDIACDAENIYKFIECADNVIDTLNKNLETNINVKNIKMCKMHLSVNQLNKMYENKEIPYSVNFIANNIESREVVEFFYNFYVDEKTRRNSFVTRNGVKVKSNIFTLFMNFSDLNDCTINLCYNDEYIMTEEENTYNSNIPLEFKVKYNDVIFMKVSEQIKFKISSPLLTREIEIFRTNKSFIQLVASFHLSCVKSYYDGKTCYMLPSAITAYMTLMNIDYRHFFSRRNPFTILIKYRNRGFGTILNMNEIKRFIHYAHLNNVYPNLKIDNIGIQIDDLLGFCPNYKQKIGMNRFTVTSSHVPRYEDQILSAANSQTPLKSLKLWPIDAAYESPNTI